MRRRTNYLIIKVQFLLKKGNEELVGFFRKIIIVINGF